MSLRKKAFETIVGKREHVSSQHFLPFQHCFQLYQEQNLSFLALLTFLLQIMLSIWTSVIFCCLLKSIGSNLTDPFTDDKILGLPKLEAFADDKSNVTQKLCFIG